MDHTLENNVTVPIPMVKQLQKGYSSSITASGGVGVFNDSIWPMVFQRVQSSGGSSYSQYAYFRNDSHHPGYNQTLNKELYNDDVGAV
jgi:hypothetical protein